MATNGAPTTPIDPSMASEATNAPEAVVPGFMRSRSSSGARPIERIKLEDPLLILQQNGEMVSSRATKDSPPSNPRSSM
jgi:hypothetical protein